MTQEKPLPSYLALMADLGLWEGETTLTNFWSEEEEIDTLNRIVTLYLDFCRITGKKPDTHAYSGGRFSFSASLLSAVPNFY
jgi:hypothetical protein